MYTGLHQNVIGGTWHGMMMRKGSVTDPGCSEPLAAAAVCWPDSLASARSPPASLSWPAGGCTLLPCIPCYARPLQLTNSVTDLLIGTDREKAGGHNGMDAPL